jgi:hypothetical protein
MAVARCIACCERVNDVPKAIAKPPTQLRGVKWTAEQPSKRPAEPKPAALTPKQQRVQVLYWIDLLRKARRLLVQDGDEHPATAKNIGEYLVWRTVDAYDAEIANLQTRLRGIYG